MAFNYLKKSDRNSYFITSKKRFEGKSFKSKNILFEVFNFAFNMSFGNKGQHRDHRSGGRHRRKNGEIFINAFQGKLSEFGFYETAIELNLNVNDPDTETWGLGYWDTADFEIDNMHIAVKSTKFYGNLLLLETNDWNKNARYIPNDVFYDILVLVRIKPDGESLMKRNRLLYSDDVDKDKLLNIIKAEDWEYDIPGFLEGSELKNKILNIDQPFILPQGSLLQGTTLMDAENYYVQAGDLQNLDEVKKYLEIRIE